MKLPASRIAIIEGLDGSGKSTAAQLVAAQLSDAYPDRSIGVTDSTGFFSYQAGELVAHEYGRIEKLSVDNSHSKVDALARLGAFTLARKALDYKGMADSDFLLSVRDSHRIDPTAYAMVYAGALGKLSTDRRLRLFDRMTLSPRADAIVHLQAGSEVSAAGIQGNVAPHESQEKLQIIAEELPRVLDAYRKLAGCQIGEIPALQRSTAPLVAQFLEPYVAVS